MNTLEHMERIERMFHSALECKSKQEQAAFLADACQGDAALQKEIEILLNLYQQNEGFLQSPVSKISVADIAEYAIISEDEKSYIKETIGAYRIIREIGRGGMGAVFLAERDDGEFRKQVAIKLLKRAIASKSVVRRFQTERQILADLEHPNIARLIDGGSTENGLPYFVMEYIEGMPVNRFCQQKNLSINERLKLFREICAAVQFAHEHSIIHRDIKPNNILVTNEGIPKLLDFGIAKVTQPNFSSNTPASTATAFRVMTPEYASPEQMRGDPVTGTTDVYSLGVLLYELVTGNRPYNLANKSPYEIIQAICEQEPVRPSLAIRDQTKNNQPASAGGPKKLLSKDLDNIILKTLRKEPERRYQSVEEFSQDISRLLNGFPVSARQGMIFYRAARFFRRHQTTVLSSLVVAFVFLLVGFLLNLYSNRTVVNESNNPKSFEAIYRDFPIERKKGGTDNVEARNIYVKAQWLWEQRKMNSLMEATELFHQATEKDPKFALAYSGLSNSYFLMSVWGAKSPTEIFPKAKDASLKAIELAPEAAEGHLSLAMVHWLYEFDWNAADREFKTAIELNPDYARAPHWYGLFLAEMGRFDEAIATEKRALSLEPQSLPVKADLARVLFYARRYDESLVQYQEILNTNPNFGAVYAELIQLYEAAGMVKEWAALTELTSGFENPSVREAYEKGGLTGYWRKALELAENSGNTEGYAFASIYARLNEKDRAFELLDKAIESRAHEMAQIKVHPALDNLRSDPRFIVLLRKMNFEP